MRDTLVIALEASWELDPVLMEKNLQSTLDEHDGICHTKIRFQGFGKWSNIGRSDYCKCPVYRDFKTDEFDS